ncbi:hypothetical protein [Caballeronia sp. INDeC2]|uniref:hypothetical protein n=1 Tax=Caballeronia sp. INDeC2 TaxID=2921747 RepID=UPI002029091D|nr:hypothetical protein [Caballeronia sp. INDeC2]
MFPQQGDLLGPDHHIDRPFSMGLANTSLPSAQLTDLPSADTEQQHRIAGRR